MNSGLAGGYEVGQEPGHTRGEPRPRGTCRVLQAGGSSGSRNGAPPFHAPAKQRPWTAAGRTARARSRSRGGGPGGPGKGSRGKRRRGGTTFPPLPPAAPGAEPRRAEARGAGLKAARGGRGLRKLRSRGSATARGSSSGRLRV